MQVELTASEPEVDEEQNELTGSYTFDQLGEGAKDRAREKARAWNVDHDWWQRTYEDAVSIGALMGICIGSSGRHKSHDIRFNGFGSQGDGASYAGMYNCVPDAVAKVTAECNDETLIGIAKDLTVALIANKLTEGGTLDAVISMGHSNSCGSWDMSCEVSWQGDAPEYQNGDVDDDQGLIHIFRRFADWIYAQLEAENEHLTSDEVIDETLRGGYLFDGDGDMI